MWAFSTITIFVSHSIPDSVTVAKDVCWVVWKRLKCGCSYVCEHTSGMSLYLGVLGVCGVLMTMWQFFYFMRNLVLSVILFLFRFLVVIKFKRSKQILGLTVMLCSLLIQ